MDINGPWTKEGIAGFLRSSRLPVRLSVIAPSGYPIVASHWFIWKDDTFLCGVPESSKVAQALNRNSRCGFEVAADAPPYKGVRGQGDVTLANDEALENLKTLITRYLRDDDSSLAKWLLSRDEAEKIIIIQPIRLMSWDYSERMSDALGLLDT